MSDEEDPYDFNYIRMSPDEEKEYLNSTLDSDSPVRGTLRRIEEAGAGMFELRQNQLVMFLGMLCPIINEEGDRVKIRHGNTELWLPKDQASRALSARKREPKERWQSIFPSHSPLQLKK